MTLQIGPQQPETLGHAIFSGLGGALQQQGQALGQQQQEQQQREAKGRQLYQVLNSQQYKDLPLNDKTLFLSAMFPEAAKSQIEQQKIGQQRVSKAQEIQLKAQEKQEKETKETRESELLAKRAAGKDLTEQEMSELSATSLRTIANLEKPVFEAESEKLLAQRAGETAKETEKGFRGAKAEDQRLSRMEELDKKGNLTTALMTKTMNALGLPLSILGSPDTEEFAKLEAEFVRDVNDVFRGQIRIFEIQAYMKTVPGLLNSPEGRRAIISNRKLLNEAKKVEYAAYKQILKENKGVPPRDLSFQIEERTGDQINDLSDRYRQGITDALDTKGPTIPMIGPNGEIADIPVYGIQQSQEQGWKIHIE